LMNLQLFGMADDAVLIVYKRNVNDFGHIKGLRLYVNTKNSLSVSNN
jgi:hypothetical protein